MSMDKVELRVSFVARTDNPDGFREFLVGVLCEEYGVDISGLDIASATTARDLIIAGIRDELGVRFDGDQLFEGCVNPQELADAILQRLGINLT